VGRHTHLCLAIAIEAGTIWLRFDGIDGQGLRFVDEGGFCQSGLGLYEGVPCKIIDKPGQAVFVSLSYWLFGFDMSSPLRLAALVGCATVLVVYGLARRLYGREAGLVAAAASACLPLHLFYQRSAMSDGVYFFWSCLALLLLASATGPDVKRKYLWTTGAGVAFGLGLSVNPATALFAGCGGLALVFLDRRKAAWQLVVLALTTAATWAVIIVAMRHRADWENVGKLYSFRAKWALDFQPSLWFLRNLWQYASPVVVIGGVIGACVAARARSRADALPLTLFALLLAFSARLSMPFVRVYLPLTLPFVLLTARLGSACVGHVRRRGICLTAICILVATPAAWEARRFVRLHSGYQEACRLMVGNGLRKGLSTHSWWTFQTFSRRRCQFVTPALAGILRKTQPDFRKHFRQMVARGCSHLILDYMAWLEPDRTGKGWVKLAPETEQGLRRLLAEYPPTFTVPNPIVSHEATAREDGFLPTLEHEPRSHYIYIYRLKDYLQG